MYKIKYLDDTVKEFGSLEGAEGAYLSHCKNVYSFTLSNHFGYMVLDSGYTRVGCEGHHIDYWLNNFEAIGKKRGYSSDETEEYGHILNMLNFIRNKRKA